MQVYEIRVLKDDRYSTKVVLEQMHLSDHSAIRAALRFAQGLPVEVWRDLECVYGLASDRPVTPHGGPAPATRG